MVKLTERARHLLPKAIDVENLLFTHAKNPNPKVCGKLLARALADMLDPKGIDKPPKLYAIGVFYAIYEVLCALLLPPLQA